MNHYSYRSNQTVSALMILVTCVVATQLDADEVRTRVEGVAHAKGVVLLQMTFPSRDELWNVRMDASRDGVDFYEAGIGLPRAYRLFKSISNDGRNTTVLVPAIAWFHTKRFFFDEPGNYWFRWGVTFRDQDKSRTILDQRDPDIRGVVVDQLVEVGEPLDADLRFIAGLADPALCRLMFGDGWFDQFTDTESERYANPDARAVKVIGWLLHATREDWIGDIMREAGPRGDIRKAADILFGVAKEFPESS